MKRLLLIALFTLASLSVQLQAWNTPYVLNSRVSSQHKPELLLYYKPQCPYCQKVLNYLHQIHRSVPLKNIQTDSQAREDLIRRGGKGQVPCLFIDGRPLYESNDIVKWLDAHQDILDPA